MTEFSSGITGCAGRYQRVNSMDVGPVTESDALAWMCYDALIGSEFERQRGWHVNLLPRSVLDELPANWRDRDLSAHYGLDVLGRSPEAAMSP